LRLQPFFPLAGLLRNITLIFFLTTLWGRHTIDEYLIAVPGDRDIIRPMVYGDALLADSVPPPGVYIFADIERLSPGEEIIAQKFWEKLQSDPSRWMTLNRPGKTLRRLELLRRLQAEGINRHRAWPVLEPVPADARYPLFLRIADDHDGARSPLLNRPEDFAREVDRLRIQGKRLEDWIACEYVGWKRPDGVFAKYAAFCVAGEVLPRGVLFAQHWQVKLPETFRESLLGEEQAYAAQNPDALWLKPIFDLAGVDYGRVDYGMDAEGRRSVWEINTNPQIVSLAIARSPHRVDLNSAWAALFAGRIRALNSRAPHRSLLPGLGRRIYWRLLSFCGPRHGAGYWERRLRNFAFTRLVLFFS
jgi:hypothetical protein